MADNYYVYYDDRTGSLLSVTNELSTEYKNGISVEYESVKPLLSGDHSFRDYVVKNDGKKMSLVMSKTQGFVFKNNLTETISEPNEKAELIVEWNAVTKCWNFILSKNFKKSYNYNLLDSKLVFFVTLEHDYDFLIRTIIIDIDELLTKDAVGVVFDSNFEKDISKLAITTKKTFKTYGLREIHE